MPTERHLQSIELSSLRVGFAGTPEFARVALQALLDAGIQVDIVLTQPDRPAGRGMKQKPSPVKQLAVEKNIPVFQPVSLRNNATTIDALKTAAANNPVDVLVVAAYGLILPQFVLDIPRFGCLNIHASLLPRWRGAAPIQRAIEAGDEKTGICIMQMEAGLDTGPVRLAEYLPILPTDTTTSLHDKLAPLGGQAIVTALVKLQEGVLPLEPQPGYGVTYAEKIQKSEGVIDWSASALAIHRKIRAFDPFPGCSAEFNGVKLKCFDPFLFSAIPGAQYKPGEVALINQEGMVVQTGQGLILIKTLQKPGGRRLPAYQVVS